jgi:hypothetical protein
MNGRTALLPLWARGRDLYSPPRANSAMHALQAPSMQYVPGVPWQSPLLTAHVSHTPFLQNRLSQSLASTHALSFLQTAHVPPPQSTSVSSPSATISVQLAATQLPLPSQILSSALLSPHAMPLGAFEIPHVLFAHVGLSHAFMTEQSFGMTHSTPPPTPA